MCPRPRGPRSVAGHKRYIPVLVTTVPPFGLDISVVQCCWLNKEKNGERGLAVSDMSEASQTMICHLAESSYTPLTVISTYLSLSAIWQLCSPHQNCVWHCCWPRGSQSIPGLTVHIVGLVGDSSSFNFVNRHNHIRPDEPFGLVSHIICLIGHNTSQT